MPLKKVTSFHIVFDNEWNNYRVNRLDRIKKWYFLERLHILSQLSFSKHIFVHIMMLYEALCDKNMKESAGQCMRLLLVIPGHIFQKLPLGNIGTSRVSAFTPMSIPDDLQHFFH